MRGLFENVVFRAQNFVVDDHRLFASGLAGLLQDDVPGVEIDVFAEVEAASKAAEAHHPDIVLLDYYLPSFSGADAIRLICNAAPSAQVIVISASLSPADQQMSEAAGAVAFLSKTSGPDDVVRAIAAILNGEKAEMAAISRPAAAVDLTAKQFEVLTLIAKGKSNKEASSILGMSPETVKSHLSEIYRRLDVVNRAEEVNAARQRGVI